MTTVGNVRGQVDSGDRGSAALATVVGCVALALGLLIMSMVVVYVLAVHRARHVADLTALAAAEQAVARVDDQTSCETAADVAERNGARQSSCEIIRAGVDVVAVSSVDVEFRLLGPVGPNTVASTSYAGTGP